LNRYHRSRHKYVDTVFDQILAAKVEAVATGVEVVKSRVKIPFNLKITSLKIGFIKTSTMHTSEVFFTSLRVEV